MSIRSRQQCLFHVAVAVVAERDRHHCCCLLCLEHSKHLRRLHGCSVAEATTEVFGADRSPPRSTTSMKVDHSETKRKSEVLSVIFQNKDSQCCLLCEKLCRWPKRAETPWQTAFLHHCGLQDPLLPPSLLLCQGCCPCLDHFATNV